MNFNVKRSCFFVGLPLLLASIQANAETLRLICPYTYSIDAQAKQTPTSGDAFFTIDYDTKGVASIRKEGLGAIFTGTVSEDEIRGEAKYEIGELRITETLFINRYTGAMTLSHSAPDGRGLIFYGKCRTAKDRLF